MVLFLQLADNAMDPLLIKAAMLYPRDEQNRKRYLQLALIEYELGEPNESDKIEIERGLLKELLSGDNPAAKPILDKRTKRGIVAGNLLRIMYLTNVFGGQNPDLGAPHGRIAACHERNAA